jgi:hypothetical protein
LPKLYRFVSVILPCTCFLVARGQSFSNDSLYLRKAVDSAISHHKQSLAENLRLYNGIAYNIVYPGAKGFPYFNSERMQKGDVFYDGALYTDVPLFYDLVRDELITESYDHLYNIQLLSDKIRYFTIAGHQFIYLLNDSAHGTLMTSGFYDLLYSNRSMVLVRREKKLQEIAKGEVIDAKFTSYTLYFIRVNDSYHKIGNNAGLLAAFADKKNMVRTYLRKNNLNFKKDPENTMMKAVAYYDQLNN